MNIGIVLNTYSRKHIDRQLAAVRSQTVKPVDVLVWRNDDWTDAEFRELAGDVRFIRASENMGVWPRFLAGALIQSDLLAVFDDDTIPGVRWLENCLECYRKVPGVYGANGLRFQPGQYHGSVAYGWKKPLEQPVQVDIVGHAWLFPRWLASRALDLFGGTLIAGEEMAISLVAQRNGFDTFAAPHPAGDKTKWGSLEGYSLGVTGKPISRTKAGWRAYESEFQRLRSMGWRLLCDG